MPVQLAWIPEGKHIDLNKQKEKTNTWLRRIQTKQCNTIHYTHSNKYTIKIKIIRYLNNNNNDNNNST